MFAGLTSTCLGHAALADGSPSSTTLGSAVNVVVSAKSVSSRGPTCKTTPAPSAVAVIFGRVVAACTSKVHRSRFNLALTKPSSTGREGALAHHSPTPRHAYEESRGTADVLDGHTAPRHPRDEQYGEAARRAVRRGAVTRQKAAVRGIFSAIAYPVVQSRAAASLGPGGGVPAPDAELKLTVVDLLASASRWRQPLTGEGVAAPSLDRPFDDEFICFGRLHHELRDRRPSRGHLRAGGRDRRTLAQWSCSSSTTGPDPTARAAPVVADIFNGTHPHWVSEVGPACGCTCPLSAAEASPKSCWSWPVMTCRRL